MAGFAFSRLIVIGSRALHLSGDTLTQHVDGIYDLIRRTRSDAGHPTGKRMERHKAGALWLSFPMYCETINRLTDWLRADKNMTALPGHDDTAGALLLTT